MSDTHTGTCWCREWAWVARASKRCRVCVPFTPVCFLLVAAGSVRCYRGYFDLVTLKVVIVLPQGTMAARRSQSAGLTRGHAAAPVTTRGHPATSSPVSSSTGVGKAQGIPSGLLRTRMSSAPTTGTLPSVRFTPLATARASHAGYPSSKPQPHGNPSEKLERDVKRTHARPSTASLTGQNNRTLAKSASPVVVPTPTAPAVAPIASAMSGIPVTGAPTWRLPPTGLLSPVCVAVCLSF